MAKATKPKIKQSETVTIKRSQINFAPYNPKNHSKEQIDNIKRNFKKVAFLGGIIFNETTSNLIDGHKRIMAMDAIYKFDGTPATDYDVKVEQTALDEKTEKEQNVFQSKSVTEVDSVMLTDFINDIDYKSAGISDLEYSLYDTTQTVGTSDDLSEVFQKKPKKTKEETAKSKADIKEAKAKIREEAGTKAVDTLMSYLTLNFPNFQAKEEFMRRFELDPYLTFVDGEDFGDRCEAIV